MTRINRVNKGHENRELSANVRGSEAVALCQPVVPVANGLDGRFVRFDGSQLRQRHGDIAAMPADQHKHVVGTGIFRCEAADFDRFSLAERRDYFGGDATGCEGKPDLVLQIVIPAERLLFGPVGINNDFVVNSFFANAVLVRLGQEVLDSKVS